MKRFGSNIEKLLTFSQKIVFLYFRKWKPQKIPYISVNITFLYLRKQKP